MFPYSTEKQAVTGTFLTAVSFDTKSISLSNDGSVIVVSDVENNASPSGRVQVYRKQVDTWQLETMVKPNPILTSDRFGYSVAINDLGTRMIVGAPLTTVNGTSQTGRLYIFDYIDNVWSQTAIIEPSAPSTANQNGATVFISGDGNTVAAKLNGGYKGKYTIQVHKYDLGTWTMIYSDTVNHADCFDLSKDGGTFAYHKSITNEIYIFNRTGDTYNPQPTITIGAPQDFNYLTQYGMSVSSDGNIVSFGLPNQLVSGFTGNGVVRVYKYNGTSYIWKYTLNSPSYATDRGFGCRVKIVGNGDYILTSDRNTYDTSISYSRIHIYKYNVGTDNYTFQETINAISSMPSYKEIWGGLDITPDSSVMVTRNAGGFYIHTK